MKLYISLRERRVLFYFYFFLDNRVVLFVNNSLPKPYPIQDIVK